MSQQPIDRLLDTVEWTACGPPEGEDSGLPYATHTGVLKIGSLELQVVTLNTGQRLIVSESLAELWRDE